jgi:aminobenzoyl-glutamate utilization protein A
VVDAPPLDARQSAAERAVAAGAPAELARHLAEHGTAVVVDIDGGRPGPRWAVRVDMDGLPIAESTDADHPPARLGFRSVTGAMHACAHDAHTAIGVGLAHRLAGTEFPGSLRLLFQPAEEGARGARAMLGRGVVDGIDRFVGVHLGEDQPVGRVVGGAHGLLATEKLRVRFTGRAAHSGLSPERGRNALAAAAQATLGLLGMPRHGGALTRVNVGRLTAGDAINVVPGWAELMCETRSDDPEVARDLGRRARAIVAGAATMYDVAAEVSVLGAATTFPPDPALVDLVMEAARRRGVTDAVEHCTVSASDDASLFAEVVREHGGLASFVVVGGGNTAPHHHPAFDIDEAALPVALDLLESLVRG